MKEKGIIQTRINKEYNIFVLIREITLLLAIFVFHLSFPTAFQIIEYPFYLMMAIVFTNILIFLPVYLRIRSLKTDFEKNLAAIVKIDKYYFFASNFSIGVLIPALGTQFINIFWFITAINSCVIFTSPFQNGRNVYLMFLSPIISLFIHYSIYLPRGKPLQPMEIGFAVLIVITLFYTFLGINQKKVYDKLLSDGDDIIEKFCDYYKLTDREREVLLSILEGKSTKQIGQDLFISPGTARNHISNIFQKSSTHSRMELVSSFNNYS